MRYYCGLFALVAGALAGPLHAGSLSTSSQSSIAIRVSVAPRAWVTAAGEVCLNLPARSFRVERARVEAIPDAPNSCGEGARSRLPSGAMTARDGVLIITPD